MSKEEKARKNPIWLFIFREHLGITDKNDSSVEDPVSSDFYKGNWLKQASINTDVYDKVKHGTIRSKYIIRYLKYCW